MKPKKRLESLETELVKLAAPIVPIKSGVAVVPLVGELNDIRANHIRSVVIPKISELNLDTVVIDFSGIYELDSYVAQHIFQIAEILELLGIEPIITGLRPKLVQTTVQLGIKIQNMKVYSNVKQYLDEQAR